jgi:hypothetical protein
LGIDAPGRVTNDAPVDTTARLLFIPMSKNKMQIEPVLF